MAGYIGSKSSVTLVDGYTEAEADAEFVNDPNSVITVSGSNVGIGTASPAQTLSIESAGNRIATLKHTDGTHAYITFSDTNTTDDGSVRVGALGNDLILHAGEERMRIDSSGNVGIGVNDPDATLDISKGTNTLGILRVTQRLSGAVAYGLDVGLDPTTGDPVFSRIVSDTVTEAFRIQRSTGNIGIGCTPSYKLDVASTVQIRAGESLRLQNVAGSSAATIQCAGAGGNSDLGFSIGGTERMRITTTRLLYSTGSMADITASNPEGVAFAKYTGQGIIRVGNTSTSGRNCVEFFNGNGQVGSILTSGSATSYNTSSDYRLKTDAQPMTGASDRVQALNPVNFEWISDGTRVDGFLAHEAATVVPEAVHGTKDAMMDEEYEVTPAVYEDVVIEAVLDDEGNELEAERTEQNLVTEAVMGTRSVPDMQGIDQSKLVPLLTAALQEALTEIASLKTRVEALEDV